MYKRVIKEPNASSVITGGKEEAIDLGTRVFVDGGEELRNFCQVASIWFVKLKKKGGGVIHEELGLGETWEICKGLNICSEKKKSSISVWDTCCHEVFLQHPSDVGVQAPRKQMVDLPGLGLTSDR